MLFYLSSLSSVLAVSIKIKKDISYPSATKSTRNQLDVYYPKDVSQAKDVLVFIHGGSWDSGKKDIYWWMGRNFASKNVVTVIINYPLSPAAGYEDMARDCASAIKWVKDSISTYGGNHERIFAMGHSAGGHLEALIDLDPRFFAEQQIAKWVKHNYCICTAVEQTNQLVAQHSAVHRFGYVVRSSNKASDLFFRAKNWLS